MIKFEILSTETGSWKQGEEVGGVKEQQYLN